MFVVRLSQTFWCFLELLLGVLSKYCGGYFTGFLGVKTLTLIPIWGVYYIYIIRVRVVGAPERLIEAPGPADAPGLEFWVTGCCCSGRARARFLEI